MEPMIRPVPTAYKPCSASGGALSAGCGPFFFFASSRAPAKNAARFMLYFAYGSNLHTPSIAEWCRHYGHKVPQLRNARSAVLNNYRLAFPVFSEYWGGGTADIVYDPGKYVAGAVFDVTEAEMAVLDAKVRRQQDESGREIGVYKAIEVEVQPTGRGKKMSAMTYQGVEQEAYHIPPTQTYVDLIVRGAFEHGMSLMWVSYLQSFSAQAHRRPRPPRA
jgi:hypothetical protein